MKFYDSYVFKKCNNLSGKTAIVTAGNGELGFYICYYLLALESKLIFTVRTKSKGEEIKERLLKLKPNGFIVYEICDFLKDDEVNSFINKYKNQEIDILIHNAAMSENKKTYVNGIAKEIYVNAVIPLKITKELRYSLKNGRTILISSNTIINPKDTYSVSKRIITEELIKLKTEMKINIVHPGITPTKLFNSRRNSPKWLINIINIFMQKPSKASLSAILATSCDTKINEWIGPRGLFHIYGFPKKLKLKHLKKYKFQDQ